MSKLLKRDRRTFSTEFKSQMVQLYQSGKRRVDLVKEYDLSSTALDRWIKQAETSGSFKEKDNRTAEENEIIRLQKELNYARMEVDILKQAALIMGRK